MNKTILITGCSGLIGYNFTNWIKKNKKEYHIIGIDDLSGSYSECIPEEIEFHQINLLNYSEVENIFKSKNIIYIYHFAAYATEGLSPFIRKYNYNNNLLVTTNLVNLAIKYNVKRFVFTSSMAVYGKGDNQLPFTEETPRIPIDPYGIAKYACEMDIHVASQQHNLEYCIIRPHNVYGIGQNIWDMYRNVLGIWMYKLINNEAITIYGTGEQKRAFSYIDDILEPLYKAAIDPRAKNQTINLGGTIEYTINDAAKVMGEVYNETKKDKLSIIYLEPRHEVKNAWTSYTKSIELLDFEMKTSLKEGIRKMWTWAQQQPNRKRKKWTNYELEKGIYSYWK